MSIEGAATPPGHRFASDLRAVREANGLSLVALQEKTKFTMDIIEQFEETGLLDHPMYNRVYLRSFVRTYASAVGIEPETVLASLDKAFAGTYRGELTALLPGAEEPPPTTPEVSSESAPVEEEPTPPEPLKEEEPTPPAEVDEPEVGEAIEPASSPDEAVAEEAIEEPTPVPTEVVDEVKEEDYTPAEVEVSQETPVSIDTNEEEEAAVAEPKEPTQPRTARRPSHRRHREETSSKQGLMILGAFAVVVIVLVVWVLMRKQPEPVPQPVVEPPRQDTTVVEARPEVEEARPEVEEARPEVEEARPEVEEARPEVEEARPEVEEARPEVEEARPEVEVSATPPRTLLGDTMVFTIRSQGPRLEGIRVTVDDDVRRPYWVDPDSAITFRAADQIILEKQFERYRVIIGGADYPTDRLDAEGRLVITRETAQAFLDSLTGH